MYDLRGHWRAHKSSFYLDIFQIYYLYDKIFSYYKVWPQRSIMVTWGYLKISKSSSSAIYVLFNAESSTTLQKCKNYDDTNFYFDGVWPPKSSKVIWDHFYAKTILAHSLMDWFWEEKNGMNANIMKIKFFINFITFMLLRSFVIFVFKTLRPNYNIDLRS